MVINGKSSRFCPTRGIRQGNPLSPYLFLLLVDVLSTSILNRAQAKVLAGIKLSRFCLELTHLFFADDYFFLKLVLKIVKGWLSVYRSIVMHQDRW